MLSSRLREESIFSIGGNMPANLEEKIKLVDDLSQKLSGAKSIVIVDYRGLTVEELTDLRSQTRANEVDYKVYKNTMVRRALEKAGIEGLTELFVGPTAIAVSQDEVAPAKILDEFAKGHKNLEIKGGYVDGKAIDVAGVTNLAKLPSKEMLVAKVLGGLNAPISGFVGVLNGTIRALAIALNQIAEQKGQEQEA